ncbi:MAG: hypothetical protein R2861_10095 [Desulfobacterales bacterium]
MMRIIALAAFMGLWPHPAPVLAHGTDYRVIADNDPVVGIAFSIPTKSPCDMRKCWSTARKMTTLTPERPHRC